MNTIEGNKLIAEFMGFQIKPYEMNEPPFTKYDEFVWDGVGAIFKPSNLVYHSSWDWLMPVVEKIETWQDGICSFFIVQNECDIAFGTKYYTNGEEINAPSFKQKGATKIEATCKTVIQFIEWYNKQQSVKVSDTSKAT